MNTCYLIFSICIISQTLIVQNFNNPMKFFPAKTGDIWEYFYSDPPYSDTLQLISTKDSIDEQGTIHLWQTSEFIKNMIRMNNGKPFNHVQTWFYLKNNLFLPTVCIFLDKSGHSGIPKLINL